MITRRGIGKMPIATTDKEKNSGIFHRGMEKDHGDDG